MKKIILFAMAMGMAFLSFSQNENYVSQKVLQANSADVVNNSVQNTHSLKTTFLGLSYAYEKAFAQKTTVNLEVMLAGGFAGTFSNIDYWIIAPILRVEPRYYYNFTKRIRKGKKVLNNSANYLSISSDYQMDTSIGNSESVQTFSIIPKWGLKRTMGKHWIFEFATGIGAYTTEYRDYWESTLGLDLKFGYSF